MFIGVAWSASFDPIGSRTISCRFLNAREGDPVVHLAPLRGRTLENRRHCLLEDVNGNQRDCRRVEPGPATRPADVAP